MAYEGLLKDIYLFTDLGERFEHFGVMKKTTRLDPFVGSVCSFNFLHLTLQEYLAVLYVTYFHPHIGSTLVVPQSFHDRETVQTFLQELHRTDTKLYRASSKAEEKELARRAEAKQTVM